MPTVFGNGQPIESIGAVSGNFSLRFDTDENYSSEAAVLSASINIPVTGPFALGYDATTRLLTIRASPAGPGYLIPGTNGFFLQFSLDSIGPANGLFFMTSDLYQTAIPGGPADVTFAITPAPAPEPAIWLTMMTGLVLTGVALRKQRRVAYG